MNNQPWDCPRCGRMNAPFNPTCFCKPFDPSSCMKKPSFEETIDKFCSDRCMICNGYHGKNVQCARLVAS